uniref:Uncharacterized protein n=1 Tax=Marseillevirus LCMAC103 TaxID=2506604 RepID=A0A481YWT5_9VIRU|nr:MAG: hypothetical protein LCMAC103_03300 [Marseillevirus LCMAC103]
MSVRFCEEGEQKDSSVALRDLRATYAVDTSGSTSGSILKQEIMSIEMLREAALPCSQMISWNSSARVVKDVRDLSSRGLTYPENFVPLLSAECQLLVLYTDGYIGPLQVEHFKAAMSGLEEKFPIVIVFTIASELTFEQAKIADLERQVNMSIPESCLEFSDDVLIIVNSGGVHRTLMSKGVFAPLGQPRLTSETHVLQLPACDFGALKDLRTEPRLPAGLVRLDGWKHPVSLERIYLADANNEADVADLHPILAKLCQRVYLPSLDLTRMRRLLVALSRKATENPEMRKTRDALAQIATGDRARTPAHHALIEKLHSLRRAVSAAAPAGALATIHKFLAMIAEYRAGSTSFVLGSNRAASAASIQTIQFQDRGECLQTECPIELTDQDACVLLKAPPRAELARGLGGGDGQSIEFLATTDLAMEAPFWCGWALRDCLTPGVFGAAFAEAATENPYTREAVIGYVPLSKNPAVVMRFVSRTFGHSKELWHMVRAYIALVAYNLDREWCSPLLKQHADVLLDAYRATVDLRGGTEKVPLRQAFQHVLANYATCLRNRYPPDIRCIVGVCERLLPGVEFEKQKIEGMAQVIETFSGLHRRHQARGSMAPNVFDTDDWGHFKAQRRDLCALISYIFWRQDCRRLEHYRHLKLMVAVDTVISRDPLGPQLLKALAGDPSFEIPPVALAEPSGDHFGPAPPFEAWSWAAGGRPKDRCVHCGYYFITAKAADGNWKLDRVAHLKKAFHPYFYNGQKAVLAAIDAQPEKRFASESIAKDIFRLAKRKLFREYGEMAGFLHTKHCKTVLAHFVTKLLECRETAIANA